MFATSCVLRTPRFENLGYPLVVVNTLSRHGHIVARARAKYNPLVAMQHGHICRIRVTSGDVLCGKVSVPLAVRCSPVLSNSEIDGWLGSSGASPQFVAFWGLAPLDPSHPTHQLACYRLLVDR